MLYQFSRKKWMGFLLAALLVMLPVALASAAEPQTVQDTLAVVEADTYGGEQAGAILDRISRLEKDYNGENATGSMMARVDALYAQVLNNGANPSVLARVNALEWGMSHRVSMKSIQTRLQDLELELLGQTQKGPFVQRIDRLTELVFGSGNMPMAQVHVPAGTLIRVELVTPLNAKELREGDTVRYQVAEDVIMDGCLLFAKGNPGDGTVTKVKVARSFGRNAEVHVDFARLKAVEGTYVDTCTGKEAQDRMVQDGMLDGAGLAGVPRPGAVDISAGGFFRGKDLNLPEGTEVYIQTEKDLDLYGVETGIQEKREEEEAEALESAYE